MDTLSLSQTLFYFTATVAILVLGVFLSIVLYHLLRTLKNVAEMSDRLNAASAEIKNRFVAFLEKLAALPILSFIAQKFSAKGGKQKGRKTN